jgi:hypothetical protein
VLGPENGVTPYYGTEEHNYSDFEKMEQKPGTAA